MSVHGHMNTRENVNMKPGLFKSLTTYGLILLIGLAVNIALILLLIGIIAAIR